MGETNNNIIGSTINPYNRYLSAGGAAGGESVRPYFRYVLFIDLSTLGEGALLALRGSPLGWGSDIGDRQGPSISGLQ